MDKEFSPESWVQRSRQGEVRDALRTDTYLPIYKRLLAYTAALPRHLEIGHAVVCVHAVYGWMPTILDPLGVGRAIDQDPDRLLDVLNVARCANEPGVTDDDLDLLKGFANNSTVGASKLLHLLNPVVYPIWDRRVAHRFLWPGVTRGTFDNVVRLRDYVTTLWRSSQDSSVQEACEDLRVACPNVCGVTAIRLMELVLFHPPLPRKRKEAQQVLL